jgi:hypothetical protein
MLTDSVNGKKNDGQAKQSIQVLDVAQLLLDSVKTSSQEEPPAGTAESETTPEPQPVK